MNREQRRAMMAKQHTSNHELTKDEIIGRALHAIDSRKAFEKLSLNGRYSEKRRKEFKILAEKNSNEANNYMNLAYRWSDKS